MTQPPARVPAASHHAVTLDVCVARQPILGADGSVTGYELLYRRGSHEVTAVGADRVAMASDVMVHTFLEIGVERLTQGRVAYLNFTRELLLAGAYSLLDPSRVVIELLEDVEPDDDVVEACRTLVEAGYTLALDDFVYTPAHEPLLALAAVVKIDVLGRDEASLAELLARVRPFGARMLAERVETDEARRMCERLGFDLFQGYFFARPENVSSRSLPADVVTIAEVMNLLLDVRATDAQIEEAVRRDPSVSYKLLRSVNAAATGGRGIESIRHALQLVGRMGLHRWLALLLVSSAARGGGVGVELVGLAMRRARMCERLAELAGRPADAGSLFLAGLFSLLDALVGVPMKELLERVHVSDDIRRALLEREGPLADALAVAEAYELADWPHVSLSAARLGLSTREVGAIWMEALEWSGVRLAAA